MESKERRILDVNVLAIFLVSDHPANSYVSKVVEEGLRGVYIPLIMDILPVRALWIMTKKWKCDESESIAAIRHFLKEYDLPKYFALTRETLSKSFELAEQLRHDVYDCVYLAAAVQEKASAIVTTDSDFEKLCRDLNLTYLNPVPSEVFRHLKEWGRSKRSRSGAVSPIRL